MNEGKLGFYGVSDIELYLRQYGGWRKQMIALEAGTVLEKEYKGNTIKVKVLKNGNLSYNGKEYDNRADLMKAITKGKTAQFTTFFGIGKEENGVEKKSKKVKKSISEETSENDSINAVVAISEGIRMIVREEIKNFFRS